MADKLNLEKINALQHPLIARFCGGDEWPVESIDVETGLMRIDVVGRLQTKHFADVMALIDGNGGEHDSDDFYHEDEITSKTVWTTKDGEQHDTLEEALAHQRRQAIVAALFTCDNNWIRNWSDTIADNGAEIFALLEPFFRGSANG